MSKIKEAFKKGKAFVGFITAGDPDLETTEKFIYAMEKAGADIIEIGIPFSDPIAEGTVIQEADARALAGGCTTDRIFEMVKNIRANVSIPLVFMTYINPIFAYGKEKFMDNAKLAGIDGIIVPDLPFEEKDEIDSICDERNIELISMIAPTSAGRVEMIAKEAKGFLYCVSSLGVTGVRTDINEDISTLISNVRKVSDIPCAVGFGISEPEQAKNMARISDGVIVGSAIVKIVAEYGREAVKYVEEYVKSMKNAIK